MKILLKQFFPITFAKQAGKEDSRERRAKLIKAVLLGVIVFAVGIGIYIALCPLIIPWLFPKYDASEVILLTSISAITLVVQPMALLSQYLEAQRMVKAIWYCNFAAAIAFALSMSVLIPVYGLLGAMIARGIFRFVYSGMSWWYVLRSPLRTD